MKFCVAALLLSLALPAQPALAQSKTTHPIRSRIVWTLVGAFVGTAIGVRVTWDDDERAAILQSRMRRGMIIGGGTGAALGFWIGSRRSRSSPTLKIRAPFLRRADSDAHISSGRFLHADSMPRVLVDR